MRPTSASHFFWALLTSCCMFLSICSNSFTCLASKVKLSRLQGTSTFRAELLLEPALGPPPASPPESDRERLWVIPKAVLLGLLPKLLSNMAESKLASISLSWSIVGASTFRMPSWDKLDLTWEAITFFGSCIFLSWGIVLFSPSGVGWSLVAWMEMAPPSVLIEIVFASYGFISNRMLICFFPVSGFLPNKVFIFFSFNFSGSWLFVEISTNWALTASPFCCVPDLVSGTESTFSVEG